MLVESTVIDTRGEGRVVRSPGILPLYHEGFFGGGREKEREGEREREREGKRKERKICMGKFW